MKFLEKLPQWLLTVIVLGVFLVGLVITGNIYRRFRLFWACLWLALPLFAYVVSSRRLDAHLTEKGFKALRAWVMIFAIGMSFLAFFDRDLKEEFGHHFIKGSKFWYVDYGERDDNGTPVASHEFYAPTALGRFVLTTYDWILIGLCILIPYVTYKSFARSIEDKEQKRLREQWSEGNQ